MAKKSLYLLHVPCHPICVTLVSWGGSSRGPISTGGWGWLTCARGLGGLAGALTAPGPAEDGPGASDGSSGSILSLPPAGAPLTGTRVVTPTVEPTSHDPIFSIESLGFLCQKVNVIFYGLSILVHRPFVPPASPCCPGCCRFTGRQVSLSKAFLIIYVMVLFKNFSHL